MPTILTVQECLARLKTLTDRIQKKEAFVIQHAFRHTFYQDPLESAGGSKAALKAEYQSIQDLRQHYVEVRAAVNRSNEATSVTVGAVTRTISEWLIWKREIQKSEVNFLVSLKAKIDQGKAEVMRNFAVVRQQGVQDAGTAKEAEKSLLVVNVDEMVLHKLADELTEILNQLDGQLSLKNATVTITFPW